MIRIFTDSPARTSVRLPSIALALALASFGCAAEGASDQGPFVSPVVDAEREQSAVVGPEGGAVVATSADGTTYTLAIPAEALTEETEISLTPIRAIEDLPMTGGLIDGVHFEPSGLQLLRAATLTVERASAQVLAQGELFVGFVYDGDGENLSLALPEVDGGTFNLPIHHFSGAGAGAATSSDLEAAFAPGTTDAFIAELVAALPADDPALFESILRRWYEAVIKPDLQAAVASDNALERALDVHGRWLDAQLTVGVFLEALESESNALAAAALREAVARANDLCERQQSLGQAEKVLTWQRRAEGVLPSDELFANGLDRESILVGLCVQVIYESTSYPEDPVAGEPEPLRVVVGYAFGNGPIELQAGVVLNILGVEVRPVSTTTATDADGVVELEMTPEGGNLRIEIDACIGIVVGAGPLVGTLVCQKAFILRGLVVAPVNVTLGPGAQQQFTAELVGVTEPVTWSADGGTIDETGRFIAGNQAGTFTVTATSIDNPSLRATGEVTIEVQESDFPVSALWEGFLNRQSRSPRKGWMATTYDPNTGELRASTCEGSDESCLGDFVGCDALWEGNVSGSQFSLTQVNHTNACAIGQPGQNRLYGCTLTGTVSEDADGTLRLVAAGDGGFFSCSGGDVEVSFEGCVGGCPEDQQASEPPFDPND